MKSIRDFIIHIPEEFQEKLIGTQLYGDSRFSQRDMGNNRFQVIEVPFGYKGDIEVGDWLIADINLYMKQHHVKTGTHESHHLINREKRFFKVPPSLIICYSKGKGTMFKAFNDTVIVERIKETVVNKYSHIIQLDTGLDKTVEGKGRVVIPNNDSEAQENDIVYFNEKGAIDIYLNDFKMVWLQTKHLLAVEELNKAV